MKIDEITLKIELNPIYPKYHLSLRHFLILFFGHYIVHIMHSDNSYMCINTFCPLSSSHTHQPPPFPSNPDSHTHISLGAELSDHGFGANH